MLNSSGNYLIIRYKELWLIINVAALIAYITVDVVAHIYANYQNHSAMLNYSSRRCVITETITETRNKRLNVMYETHCVLVYHYLFPRVSKMPNNVKIN